MAGENGDTATLEVQISPTQNNQQQDPNAGPEQHEDTADMSLDEIKKLKGENQGFRNRLKTLEELIKKFDPVKTLKAGEAPDPRLLEIDNLKATLEAERKTLAVERQITILGNKLGIEYPELVLKSLALDDVEFDDSGKPLNVESLLKDYLKKYPKMGNGHKESPAGVDAGNGGAAKVQNMNDIFRRKKA